MHPDEILTTAEVADLLKMSQASVQRWCKAGELEAFNLGTWRIPLAAVEKFLQARVNTARERTAAKSYKLVAMPEQGVD